MATQQLGNTMNGSIPASTNVVPLHGAPPPIPALPPEAGQAPVRQINPQVLSQLGSKYKGLFDRYAAERLPAEQRWLKNLRQYMGYYDPDVESQLAANRSRAYPRLTRKVCVSLLSRLMNLMFPGNEDNWELTASPSPEMNPDDVGKAVQEAMQRAQASGAAATLTQELIDEAVRELANKQAAQLTALIKDQLHELGGSQTQDWIGLNRKVAESGIRYGIGLLEGPYVRKVQTSGWAVVAGEGFKPVERTIYKPMYEFLPCWDFYPDMSAKTLPGEGYFVRKVMGRGALRKLADRPQFLSDQIKQAITNIPNGNYRAKSWETELRSMGTAIQAPLAPMGPSGREKYEVIIWKGPVSSATLREVGADVPENMMADDVEAELWMVDNYVIRAEINAWRTLGVDMQTVHVFNFDEDDTSPISQGLPYVVRDSQLGVCAATRMTLDNASVTCGPNIEVNTALMRADQDLNSIEPWKIWYRDDEGLTAQFPAVRRIEIDGHLGELQGLVNMFMSFAEMETFIGPSTGGDMTKVPSEAGRTAAGQSMLRGDAALPFKDIVRNYDSFTQSVIWSIVNFNRKFNPDEAPGGDYNVIPRGATSLIAKEVRGIQIDALSQTLTEEERDHVDDRKMVEAKFGARDLQGVLVSEDEAKRRKDLRAAAVAEERAKADQMLEANVREVLSSAFKNITQGQKNVAAADAAGVNTAISILETGLEDETEGTNSGGEQKAS